jgi:hypothetical protein
MLIIYRRHLNMSRYGAASAPVPGYSPLLEAWRSGRITTKKRDYVLAVFPDIDGYAVPQGARKMSFPDLLENALSQAPIQARFHIVPKVPRGLMMDSLSSKVSISPWAFPDPANIGEAYDGLTACLRDPSESAEGIAKFHLVTKQATLEEIDFSMGSLPGVLEICAQTMDGPKQMALVSPAGPCTGTTRGSVQTQRGLVQHYLVHQFAPVITSQYLSPARMDALQFASKGIVSFDAVKGVPMDEFREEMRRYLVCMVCGTSPRVADSILDGASPRVVATPFGKLLAVVRNAAQPAGPEETTPQTLSLLCSPRWFMQGFLIARETNKGIVVIGRTVVPSGVVWDAISKSVRA